MDPGDGSAVRPEECPIPGVVGIFSQDRPINLPIPIHRRRVEIGRGVTHGATRLDDDRTSRKHTVIEWCGTDVRVTDRKSRNHTFIDGREVQDEVFQTLPRILRIGHTLFRFTRDIRPFLKGEVSIRDNRVIGPTLRELYEEIASVAAAGETLLLTGPSGSGKELAAEAFHAAGKRRGPFVAVNCATIPAGVAERLLFGVRKGAFTDCKADEDGYIQAADGGTLFLDEIAELDPSVQPKLLRVLQTREVMPLGASAARKVDIRLCTATLKDLRAEVVAGRFRNDLYFRIHRPVLCLPSLVERLEELPWLARAELQRVSPELVPSALFLEACALRPWPGNVRELLSELRSAGRAALKAGRVVVERIDLSPAAGQDIAADSRPPTPRAARDSTPDARPRVSSNPPPPISSDAIEAALQQERGNVTGAARLLGVHRTQLRRWITRFGIDPTAFGGSDGEDEGMRADQENPPGKG